VGEAIGPGLAREVPPDLPFRWARAGGRLWRRPFPGLLPWVESAFRPVGTGWEVRPGRLAAVDVETRTGDVVGAPRRVVALGLDRHRRTGRVRLSALLDDERQETIMKGWRVTGFARWLADRADLPLHESGEVDEKHSVSDRFRAGQPVISAPPP
jgi:hypothetical protein